MVGKTDSQAIAWTLITGWWPWKSLTKLLIRQMTIKCEEKQKKAASALKNHNATFLNLRI